MNLSVVGKTRSICISKGKTQPFKMNIHETAQKAFQKGEIYDKYRPTYTFEVIDKVIEIIRNNEITLEYEQNIRYDILELGAGTGKFTQKLKEQLKQETLLASEPSEGFLTVLKQSCPDVECSQFAANNIPLPDSSVKAVVCAQCFHWFANVPSLSEIDRVLVPGGLLFLVYNRQDRRYPMVDELVVKMRSYMGDNPPPQYNNIKWNLFNEIGSFKRFQDIVLDGIEFKGQLKAIHNFVCSISYIHNLPDAMKVKVMQDITEIIKSYVGDQPEIDIPFYSLINVFKKQN